MAYPISSMTLAQLRASARQRADMVNSDFVTDAEFNEYINMSYAELYDVLIQKFGNDYFVASPYAFSTTASTSTVALPSDFYKAMGLDVSISGGSTNSWYTVKPFNFGERNKFNGVAGSAAVFPFGSVQYRINGSNLLFIPTPMQAMNFRLWYIPRLTPLVADADSADGVSGWLEYVIVDAAIKALNKEESDTSVLRAQKAGLVQRIEAAAENRDAGTPATVTDVNAVNSWEDSGNGWGF